jgi:hypothetical protein
MLNSDFRTQLTNKHFELSHSGAVKLSTELYSVSTKCQKGWSQWLQGLRSGSMATHLLRLWVRILPRAWTSVSLRLLRVVKLRSRWGTNHSSREALPSVVCLGRGLHEATLHATCQRVQSPASEWAGSKPAMLITCRNKKAGQSAGSALVHHLTIRDELKNISVLSQGTYWP